MEAEPETELEPTGAVYLEIEPSLIETNPKQPRSVFDEEALAELVHSIREFGLMQPIVVRRHGDKYQLVMGERRWRASQEAGLEKIPAIIRETDDDSMLRDALLENIHRVQLNPPSKRQRRISSCSRSSKSPTKNWPIGSDVRVPS